MTKLIASIIIVAILGLILALAVCVAAVRELIEIAERHRKRVLRTPWRKKPS